MPYIRKFAIIEAVQLCNSLYRHTYVVVEDFLVGRPLGKDEGLLQAVDGLGTLLQRAVEVRGQRCVGKIVRVPGLAKVADGWLSVQCVFRESGRQPWRLL